MCVCVCVCVQIYILQFDVLIFNPNTRSSLGLDGEGQIVGVSDTGIDENSCFFRDSYHGKVIKSSIDNPQVDHKNRKIVEYITYSDNYGDVEAGHGSHVCGTIAGSCMQNDHSASSNIKKYHGIAPKAKIAFFDIMGGRLFFIFCVFMSHSYKCVLFAVISSAC